MLSLYPLQHKSLIKPNTFQRNMCGIFAYIGKRDLVPLLIGGLKDLEYRGSDSWGYAVIEEGNLRVQKREGKIGDLEQTIASQPIIKGNIGIAHTRWPTHGAPNEINAHPHVDSMNQIAIVHNGIIENYHELGGLLNQKGYRLVSETDSEIFAHLISMFYKGNLEEAIKNSLELIEGTYGLAVIHANENKIVAARKGSPLILGIGNNEIMISSDPAAIIRYTRNMVYLDDNETVVITPYAYEIRNRQGQTIDKEIEKIKWTVESMKKGNFKHYMLKEIHDQPASLRNCLRGRITRRGVKLSLDMDVNHLGRIFLTGCGTSWHSALIGKYLIEGLTRIPVEVDYASEFRYRNPIINKNDLVVAISQSGETADTLAAIVQANSLGAKTMGIVNVVGSSIARKVNFGMYLHAGPEIGVASTKAFTSQVMSLLLFALDIRQRQGKEMDQKLLRELSLIPEKVEDIISQSERIKDIAQMFKNSSNAIYLGRGINFPTALEGALKLKEISYIHAEGIPAAEIKHGPLALIDENMPVIFVATNDNLSDKILSNIQEVKTRNGRIIAVVNEDNYRVRNLAEHLIIVPKTLQEASPILNSVPLQLFAYFIADSKKIDVDKPRNLAKSVTVE